MSEKKPTTVAEYLRYEFTDAEVREKSKTLALSVQKKVLAQEEQKAAQAQFKERIEGAETQIGKLSREVNMGWEMRMVDCDVTFHVPQQGMKRITRMDTGEVVKEVVMQTSEMQENLFDQPAKEEPTAECETEGDEQA